MNPLRSLRRLLLLVCAAGIAWTGCGPGERDREKAPSSPGSPSASSPAASPSKAEAPAKTEAAAPLPKKEVPEAIKDLQAKIQPPGLTPEMPDEKALRAEAEELGKVFVAALQKGDREAALKLVFSAKDFQEAVTPGHRAIIESNISAQNDVVVQKLSEALKGKQVKTTWKPGELTTGAKSVFQKTVPLLTNAALEIDAAGVPVVIQLDQVVYHDGAWKIFRLSLP